MAHLRRVVNSDIEWMGVDLKAYHITVSFQTKRNFFGVPHLPLPTHPTLVSYMNNERSQDASGRTKKLLHYLDISVIKQTLACGGDADANFMAKLLETLGYDDHRRIIFICHPLPLTVCGTSLSVEMDISIIEDNEVLMLVCSEARMERTRMLYAEAAVITGAIAAFGANNKVRVASHLPPLSAMTIPAIVIMNGGKFFFYKIPVTAELSEAVARGTYPTNETHVLGYIPLLHTSSMSMANVHIRKPEFLAFLAAFKQFVRN
ncbi:hypothetical protein BDR04DRAFT_1090537 [Suillus decipiens]|nr:hypothetical protein BDR04DRAFT_1090537 [Suillus decipiens]